MESRPWKCGQHQTYQYLLQDGSHGMYVYFNKEGVLKSVKNVELNDQYIMDLCVLVAGNVKMRNKVNVIFLIRNSKT